MTELEDIVMKKTKQEVSKRKVLVTAALPYINNVPHLGHIVGSHLPADIFARYCRTKGYDVMFVGGSDDNGTPAVIAAREIGVDIDTFEDKVYGEHKKIYDWFGISYDNFSRTSRPVHHQTTLDFFKRIQENGYISEGKLESFYCPKDDRFLPDRYVKGSCPKCGNPESFGDQCEKCGTFLETKELESPKCTLCGTTPYLKESNHLFLRLDKLSDQTEKWLNTKEGVWRPQVLNQALGWIKEGLLPRCITRDLEQGVKVPVKGFEDKVFYVWFDAPIGYISATKEAAPDRWEEFWKGSDSEIFHFLGKDNIPFHTIFWPSMLLANGEFKLPHQVVGLQYLNYEGGKFSKSKKRGVFCESLVKSGLDADVMRSYLTFLIPEGNDTEFRWSDFQSRVNDEVIGSFANFVNRTVSFAYSKLDGNISRPTSSRISDADRAFADTIAEKRKEVEEHLEKAELRDAFGKILSISREGNKYFDHNAPWKLIKEDRARTNDVIYNCLSLCRTLAVLSSPYVPKASQKIWDQLSLEGKVDNPGNWDDSKAADTQRSYDVKKPEILFKKITPESVEELKTIASNPIDLKELF